MLFPTVFAPAPSSPLLARCVRIGARGCASSGRADHNAQFAVLIVYHEFDLVRIVGEPVSPFQAPGLGSLGWFAGLAGGWHQPSASAVAKATKVKEEAQKAQEEAQKAKEEAQKTKEQAKKWADERVATVGNQIILEKSKNAELEKEVKTKDQKLEDQATLIQWYQKKFGKAPDNLPKIK